MLNRASLSLLLFTALFSQGCVNAQTQLGKSDSHGVQATTPEPGLAKSSISGATAASRVYRDPVTGEFKNSPPDANGQKAPGSDRQSVILEPSPSLKETAIEGGGTQIHLQGRFRSYMSVTKDAAGKTTVHCKDGLHKK